MAYDKVVDSAALDNVFTDIANAIRAKNGSSDKYSPNEMAVAIDAIELNNEDIYEALSGIINRDVTSLIIPDGITNIGSRVFQGYSSLESISLPDGIIDIGDSAFSSCSSLTLTSLPSNITNIGNNAFSYCLKINLTSLPSSILSIGQKAFAFCSGLKNLTFNGTPTSIYEDTFQYCTNLTAIYVPWSEGKVANAPWGATNATIYYNSNV